MKMKKIILISVLILGFFYANSQKVTFLDEATFKKNVWNFEQNADWKYAGDKPIIVDFYAEWCRPCKMIAPHLVELQKTYGNKIQVYKIDTDKNKKLARLFKIRSIPTLLFIPVDGNYKQIVGYRNVEQFEELVSSILKVNK